jgi:hypothetical protein
VKSWSGSETAHERGKGDEVKVYVTKYALTQGIMFWPNAVRFEDGPLVSEKESHSLVITAYGEGREWHNTFTEALCRANDLRDAKIKSLEARIAKLKAMRFDDPSERGKR